MKVLLRTSWLLALMLPIAWTLPIPNGLLGPPEIACRHNRIHITFNTRENFFGHVFVKGRYDEPGCRSDEGNRHSAGIELPFDNCGVSRTRSLNPRGIYVDTTVIISFHPLFLTKVDQAYHIQCFYMEADKTVSQELEVSMLTTALQTEQVLMPVCRYEILDGGPTGEMIKFAVVGQQVYHKWICDTETQDTFCMTVHSCFVGDGAGQRVDLLNADGCALDKHLLDNLEYQPETLMAGKEAHVFKYADKPQLFFQCQITISVKDPGVDCAIPACPEPSRGKRSVAKGKLSDADEDNSMGVCDVRSQTLETLDLEEKLQGAPFSLNRRTSDERYELLPEERQPAGFCLSPAALAAASVAAVLLLGAGSGFVALSVNKRR